jgi:hypothetical protein
MSRQSLAWMVGGGDSDACTGIWPSPARTAHTDLARSLSNLGIRLSDLGRPAEALTAEQEAVAMYRELAAASPDRYRPASPDR